MINTDFMKILEDLDRINEEQDSVGTNSLHSSKKLTEDVDKVAASKKFWAAAKNNQIDEESFHTAFDTELAELGLDVFNTDGTFKDRNIYGKIVEVREANPDSWAAKALAKLWYLRYKQNILFKAEREKAEIERKQRAEEDRKREEERLKVEAETLKRVEAVAAQAIQDFKDTLPAALKLVDKELYDEYMNHFNLTDADIDIEIKYDTDASGDGYYSLRSIKFLPNNSKAAWKLSSRDTRNRKDPANLAKFLEAEFESSLEKVRAAEKEAAIKRRQEINSAIDILKYDPRAKVILLGESGTLYKININPAVSKNRSGKVVNSLEEITEPYKVIYTCSGHEDPSNDNSTYRDSHYYYFHSWDSSAADKLAGYIPKIGRTPHAWAYSDTVETDGEDSGYSKMDNIDSWAYEKLTSLATD